MTNATHIFETHLTVSDLERSIRFYKDTLGFPLAALFESRKVAFFWIGDRGRSMLGVWETGSAPQRMSLHTAFSVTLDDLLQSPARLREAGVTPLDFNGRPIEEPVVLAWMPAASVYFQDPDGNMLEYIAMLEEPSEPEAGILPWSEWLARRSTR